MVDNHFKIPYKDKELSVTMSALYLHDGIG